MIRPIRAGGGGGGGGTHFSDLPPRFMPANCTVQGVKRSQPSTGDILGNFMTSWAIYYFLSLSALRRSKLFIANTHTHSPSLSRLDHSRLALAVPSCLSRAQRKMLGKLRLPVPVTLLLLLASMFRTGTAQRATCTTCVAKRDHTAYRYEFQYRKQYVYRTNSNKQYEYIPPVTSPLHTLACF